MLCQVTGAPAPAVEEDIAEARELGFSVKGNQRVMRMRKLEPYEPGSRRFIFCKDVLITAPVSALCRHNLKNIIPPGRRSIKNLKRSSVRYTGDIFELGEADH
eukprot:4887949-Pyramimonas_sp.AAC.1